MEAVGMASLCCISFSIFSQKVSISWSSSDMSVQVLNSLVTIAMTMLKRLLMAMPVKKKEQQ
jgi:hypothetical protein